MKTTVNGKEIKVFGRNDISVIFTQKVNEMLAQGYMFYFDSGSQGEEGKVCLTNDGGKTVYVFYVHKEYETIGEKSWERADTILITAEKFTLKYVGEALWLGKGEKFFEAKWFSIGDRGRKDVYVESLEDFKMIEEVKYERWTLRYERNNAVKVFDKKYYKFAVSILNKRSGYKSVKVRHITKVERRKNNGEYYVYFEKSGNRHCVSL